MATEAAFRAKPGEWLKQYIGIKEGSEEHKAILKVFNDSGLCSRYKMTTSDAWCATAVSAAFIASGLSSIFPCVECSCANMITLANNNGIWEEDDSYTPEIGDVILYDWQDTTGSSKDNTGNPDHVGIVTAVSGTSITVLEGNKNDTVGYRSMTVNGKYIRGYVLPDYESLATVESNSNSGSDSSGSGLAAGTKVMLSGAKLYKSATASAAAGTKSGTYYIWEGTVTNSRIRITNSSANVGKSGQITGWVNVSDCVVASTSSNGSSSSGSSGSSSGSSGSSTSSSKPSYTVGKTYTLQVDKLNVRKSPSTDAAKVSYANLTENAKKNAYSNGQLKKGTKVTCKAVKTVGSDIWMQIPSGWIAAYYNSKVYVK